jgi:uncharacterized protein YuzE
MMSDCTYDAESRAACLRLSHDTAAETVDLMSGVFVDVDGAGSVLGIELVCFPAELQQVLFNTIDEALRRQGLSVGPSWTTLTASSPWLISHADGHLAPFGAHVREIHLVIS